MENGEIFNVLHELGFEYARRLSARGVPYAAFRIVGVPGTAETGVTAIGEHGVFRLTSHRIDTAADALALVRIGARFPLGAAYRSPADGSAELSVSVFVGDAALTREIVSPLLDYLVEASAALGTGGAAPRRPVMTDETAVPAVDIRAALATYGHQLTPQGHGFRMAVPLSPHLGCSIVLRDEADAWLSASASYVPEQRLPAGEPALGELQKLQRWTAAGRFVLDDTLLLRAEVMTPFLGQVTAAAVVWTASQCAAMLQTAARSPGLMASQDRPNS